jgi:hypothetical protein
VTDRIARRQFQIRVNCSSKTESYYNYHLRDLGDGTLFGTTNGVIRLLSNQKSIAHEVSVIGDIRANDIQFTATSS